MASDARLVRGQAQKELVKAFESICGRHGRWEVWSDWITMSACAISNAVDLAHREKREGIYLTAQKKYTAAEVQTMGEMLGMVVAALEDNQDQDLLGEIFMALELGNDHNGQFFTPYDVCRAMSAMTIGNLPARIEEQGWVSVADPACGAGALLIAFANDCRRPGRDVNYQSSVLFVAQDIDYVVGMMCYIQLSLLGCPGYVAIGDTLAHPVTAVDRRGLIPRDEGQVWYTPMYFHRIWHWRRIIAKMEAMFGTSWDAPQELQRAAKQAAASKERETPMEPQKTPKIAPRFGENEHGQLTLF